MAEPDRGAGSPEPDRLTRSLEREGVPGRHGLARYAFPGLLLLLITYGFFGIEDLPREWKVFFAAAAGLICYLLTFADVRIGLALVIVASGISPEFELGGIDVRLEDFLIPIVFLAWLALSASDRRRLRWSPVLAPSLALLGILALATLNAVVVGEATRPLHSLFHFARIAGYFLLFIIAFNAITSPRDIKAFVLIVLLACGAVALFGAYQALLEPAARTSGPRGETPNIFAGYLLFHGMLVLGLLLTMRAPAARFALVGFGLLLFVPFLYAQSRGAYAALVAAVLATAVLRAPKLLVALALGAALFPFVAPTQIRDRVGDIPAVLGEKAPGSWRARVYAWQYESERVIANPWTGVGVGTLKMGDIDSEYVLKAREGGLLAVLAFLWLLVRLTKLAFGLGDRVSDPFLRGYAIGYLGGLVGLMVHALSATVFTTIRTMEPFWIATGLLAGIDAWLLAHPADAEAGEAPTPAPATDAVSAIG